MCLVERDCCRVWSPYLSGTSEIGPFCGTPESDGPKEPIASKDRNMLVKFYSDHSETAPGFWAHFTAQGN